MNSPFSATDQIEVKKLTLTDLPKSFAASVSTYQKLTPEQQKQVHYLVQGDKYFIQIGGTAVSLKGEVYSGATPDTNNHITQYHEVTYFSESGLHDQNYNIPTEEQLTKMANIAGSVETLSELLQICDAGWYNFQTHARCCAGNVGCIWVKGSPGDTKMKYLVANKSKGVYSIVDSDDSKQGNQVRIVLEQ